MDVAFAVLRLPLVHLLLATEEERARDLHVVENHLSGVAGPNPVLLELLPHRQRAVVLGLGRHDEAGVAPRAELGVDDRDHHVDVGDAAVGDPCLGAVQRPLVLGLVVHSAGPHRRDIGTGIGLRRAEGAELDVVGGAVTLGHPFHDLLARGRGRDASSGERAPHEGHGDAGVTPEQLFQGDHHRQPGRVVHHHLGHELPPVEPDLGGLFDDRPGRLLDFVPVVSGRTHDLFGEPVDPLLQLNLIFVEIQGVVSHVASRSSRNTSKVTRR